MKKLINKLIKLLIYGYYGLLQKLRRDSPKIILILGHRRSGSTLLAHILMSNAEIAGRSETWRVYKRFNDFFELEKDINFIYRRLKLFNVKYILDKILDDRMFSNPELLKCDSIYSIFLIREPLETLPSALKTGLLFKPDQSQNETYEYYIKRLSMLEKFAKAINNKNRSFFLTYDDLINNSNTVLKYLTKFLNLKFQLVENYDVYSFTGKLGSGDRLGNIKAGTILHNPKSTGKDVEFSEDLVMNAKNIFNHYYKILPRYCTTIRD